jgi:hypothetical protein
MTKILRMTNRKHGQFIVRSARQQPEVPLRVTPELENWLLEAADKPITPLTHGDFESIRNRKQMMRMAVKRPQDSEK